MIKRLASVAIIVAGSLTVLFAQWPVAHERRQPYDGKKSPPVTLPEAYNLALAALGQNTNEFYCIMTTCLDRLPMMTSAGVDDGEGWTFEFSNTNGSLKHVLVYFDKATWVAPVKSKGVSF